MARNGTISEELFKAAKRLIVEYGYSVITAQTPEAELLRKELRFRLDE